MQNKRSLSMSISVQQIISEIEKENLETAFFDKESRIFWLTNTPDGLEILLKSTKDDLNLLIPREKLNYINLRDGKSIAFKLSSHPLGRQILGLHDNCLANVICEKTLNHIISEGPYKGSSVAFCLSYYPEGQAILSVNNYALAKLIHKETLNYIIFDGKLVGRSVVFCLIGTLMGYRILYYALAKLISEETLNHIFSNGPHKGKSFFVMLLKSPLGHSILSANNDELLNLISGKTLYHIFFDGLDKEKSVAIWLENNHAFEKRMFGKILNYMVSINSNVNEFLALWLRSTPEGRAVVLSIEGYTLESPISAENLSHIFSDGLYKGESLLSLLSRTPEGCLILSADNYALAELISEQAFNRPILNESIALRLSKNKVGRKILCHNTCRLGKLLSVAVTNYIVTEGECKGEPVALWLSSSPEGLEILSANDFKVGDYISEEILNHIISDGPHKGKSVAFFLVIDQQGLAILSANNYALAKLISSKTLNSIIPYGPYKGISIVSWLSSTSAGKKVLAIILSVHRSSFSENSIFSHDGKYHSKELERIDYNKKSSLSDPDIHSSESNFTHGNQRESNASSFFGVFASNNAKSVRQGYVRSSVKDSSSYFAAFGICRKKACELLVSSIENRNETTINIIQELVQEALWNDKYFYNFLIRSNILTNESSSLLGYDYDLCEYDYRHKIEYVEITKDTTTSIYVSSLLPVLAAYIPYDVIAGMIGLGWDNPKILQALAHVKQTTLRMWRIRAGDEALVPYEKEVKNYSCNGRSIANKPVDIVFVDNHFEKIELVGYDNISSLSGQLIFPCEPTNSWQSMLGLTSR